ncbi:TonB-dependent siderophore receptor [Horticoccus sp. 23ND18S-11]|uniref:TonB-dependent siderophore receptor n=1 Tax=Horticoccus sp. 23ND18S-11 TaxID=3391832 RepID=UPI0039C994EB
MPLPCPSATASCCRLAVLSALLALAPRLRAQTIPPPATATTRSETVLLNPFEVNTSKDTGYAAGSSLAGGRADTPLRLTPASISVMTKEFMDDLNITSLESASNWATSVMPGNERQNESPFGTFQFNFRNTGGSGNYPTRNYFLFYANSDAYNTERFEFARGPNSLLFGDAALGGVSTNFTKQARFNLKRSELRLQADTDGGWRSSLDTQWGTDRFGIRANGLVQRNQGWRDGTYEDREGVHLAASYKVAANTQVRAEVESLRTRALIYQTTYSDNASYWNGTTVNNDNTTIASPNNVGLEQFGGNAYLIYSFTSPAAGVLDWRTSYRTRGTGFAIKPEGRSDIANSPRLPSREFNLGPIDSNQVRQLNNNVLYVDHRINDAWFAQLAYFRMDHDAEAKNTESRATDYRVDVNRLLPNGQLNPKFGKVFADIDQQIQYQDNRVEDVRFLTTYKFDWKKAFDLKQRLSFIGGFRPERFEMWQRRMRRVNNAAVPLVTDARNIVRYRVYWDEPFTYAVGNQPPSIPGAEFKYADIGFGSKEHKDLTYMQVVSASTFFNERLSLLAGIRRDTLKRRIIQQYTNDPITGYSIYGGFDPSIKANRPGYEQNEKINVTSSNLGAVFYVLPWLGLQANYSENFGLPTSGVNKYDGSGFTPPKGKGSDLGVKFSLAQNKLYAVISRYESSQVDRILGGGNLTEIRRIWTNMGATEDAKINFNYRDTEDIEAKGWEAEIVANPLPNVRLSANYARPEATIIQQRPGQQAYVAANLAAWTAAGALSAPSGSVINPAQIRADILTINNALEGIAKGATTNSTYRDSTNFYGTYTFTGGAVKGLNVGAGGNHRGTRKIGNRDARLKFNTNSPTATQIREAAFDYLYAPSTFEATMHASYDYRFSQKIRARFQLNVTNLLNTKDLVITSYGTYNEGGLGANPIRQTDNAFYYINPRKFTFSTTFNF